MSQQPARGRGRVELLLASGARQSRVHSRQACQTRGARVPRRVSSDSMNQRSETRAAGSKAVAWRAKHAYRRVRGLLGEIGNANHLERRFTRTGQNFTPGTAPTFVLPQAVVRNALRFQKVHALKTKTFGHVQVEF